MSTRQQSILAVSARAAILGPPALARSRTTVEPSTATAPPSTETQASLDQAMMRLPLVPQARLRCLDLGTRGVPVIDGSSATVRSTQRRFDAGSR
ncbi:hypothetical protein AB0M95_13725 [Sphaerisporangium sp. NPDC051017]|uniref:hypothetical protein n=1 Tax=Sphaerisporangium sp. NPDC051017 TaxID=3154636 RepID=UPI0034471048